MAVAKHIAPVLHDEHDADVSAKRVVPTSPKGLSASYEDADFTVGDSPALMLVNGDLGRNGRDGYIVNDGNGDFTIEISDDGTNYGGVHTLKIGERLMMEGISINKIRITHSGTNSSYRVFII